MPSLILPRPPLTAWAAPPLIGRLRQAWASARMLVRAGPIAARAAALVAGNGLLLLLVCALFLLHAEAESRIERAFIDQHAAFNLNGEVRRSFEDLGRMSRLFAATGDAQAAAHMRSILRIRDGRAPRPPHHGRGYWDQVLAGRSPGGLQPARSLSALADDAGLSRSEKRRLLALREESDRQTRIDLERIGAALAAGGGDAPTAAALARPHLLAPRALQRRADLSAGSEAVLRMIEARTAMTQGEARRDARLLSIALVLAVLASVGAAIATAAMLFLRVIRPLVQLAAAARRIAADPACSLALPYRDRRDEMGALARALAGIGPAIASRDRAETERFEQARRSADQLAVARERTERARQVEALASRFRADVNAALARVADASGRLNECAQTMTLVAAASDKRIASADENGRLAAAQAFGVAGTSRSLAGATAEIDGQTNRSIGAADRAVEAVARSCDAAQHSTRLSDDIDTIVGTINRIAAQTRRLSLNATIEAARAGAAGRGFAVVAGEVKSLAHRTAEATADIGARLSALRASSHETEQGVRALAATIEECRGHALAVSRAVDGQVRATEAISANADGAAGRTREMVDTVSSIRRFAGENERAIGEVTAAVASLSEDGERMGQLVDDFVRALG